MSAVCSSRRVVRAAPAMLLSWPLLLAPQQRGWNDCPFGLVDDPAPGSCAAFVDEDNDGICDHSQPPPWERARPPQPDAARAPEDAGADADASGETDTGTDRSRRDVASECRGGAPEPPEEEPAMAVHPETPAVAADAAAGAAPDGGAATAATANDAAAAADWATTESAETAVRVDAAPAAATGAAGGAEGTQPPPETARRRPVGTREYYFGWLSLVVLALYSASRLLVARCKLSRRAHRRLWNVVLLFGFLGVGVTGLLMVLRVSYGVEVPAPLTFLFWHVECGIVFALVGAVHLWWHLRYYWHIVRPPGRCGTPAGAGKTGARPAGDRAADEEGADR